MGSIGPAVPLDRVFSHVDARGTPLDHPPDRCAVSVLLKVTSHALRDSSMPEDSFFSCLPKEIGFPSVPLASLVEPALFFSLAWVVGGDLSSFSIDLAGPFCILSYPPRMKRFPVPPASE